MPKRLLLTLVAGWILPLGGLAVAAPLSVPVWIDGDGRLRTNVVFESGDSLPFVVDTGMMSTVYLPELVDALGLQPRDGDAAGRYPGLTVRVGGVVEHQIPDTDVLDMKISDDAVYGVLGIDFLSRFVVEHDVREGVLRLWSDVAPPLASGRFASASLRAIVRGLYTMKVTIGGLEVEAFLDTGASISILNQRTVAGCEPGLIRLDDGEIQLRTGASRDKSDGRRGAVGAVALEEHEWRSVQVAISDGVLGQLGLIDRPAMLVGANMLLDGRRFVIDYDNDMAYFELGTEVGSDPDWVED